MTLPDTLELDELLAAIRERLEHGRNLELWKGSVATIDFGARIVLPDALDSIIHVLKDGYGILPTAVVSEIPETRAAADRLTLTLYDVLPTVVMPPVGQTPEPEKAPQIGQGNALYIPHTVRSGQRILHNGAVIVNGDVNPDAEVIAAGDIVVLGTLRGVAHAGASGDDSSKIFARKLIPVQLRISSIYTRSPDHSISNKGAEYARIKNGAIDINPW
jgi:septum site-determining protein MinC